MEQDCTLFVLQAIDLCNLNCKYCYLPGRKDPLRMPRDILEASIKQIFSWQQQKNRNILINWNAGEPLTATLAFYKEANELINRYNLNPDALTQTIQSNGILINDEWGSFFKETKTLVTISVDGPAFIHDRFRVNWKGNGSHALVQKGIDTLRKYQENLSAICVLTDYSLNYPEEIFDYFNSNGFKSVGFNIEEQEAYNSESSFTKSGSSLESLSSRYAQFLKKIYHLCGQHGNRLQIREIEAIKRKLSALYMDSSRHVINHQNIPLEIITIGKNGDLFTFSPEMTGGTSEDSRAFVVGNIKAINTFEDILLNKNFIKMFEGIQQGVDMCQSECEYFGICGGGVPINKFSEHGTFACTETSYCRLSQKTVANTFVEVLQTTPN